MAAPAVCGPLPAVGDWVPPDAAELVVAAPAVCGPLPAAGDWVPPDAAELVVAATGGM